MSDDSKDKCINTDEAFHTDCDGNIIDIKKARLKELLYHISNKLDAHQDFVEEYNGDLTSAKTFLKHIKTFFVALGISGTLIITVITLFLNDIIFGRAEMVHKYSTSLSEKIEKKSDEINRKLNEISESTSLSIKAIDENTQRLSSKASLLDTRISKVNDITENAFQKINILSEKIQKETSSLDDLKKSLAIYKSNTEVDFKKQIDSLKDTFSSNNNVGFAIFPIHFRKTNEQNANRTHVSIPYQSSFQQAGAPNDTKNDEKFVFHSFLFNKKNDRISLHYLDKTGNPVSNVYFKEILFLGLSSPSTRHINKAINASIKTSEDDGQYIELSVIDDSYEDFKSGIIGSITVIYSK